MKLSSYQTFLLFLFIPAFCGSMSISACIDPDQSPMPLTPALLSTPAAMIDFQFSPCIPQSLYSLTALGLHESVIFPCQNSTIILGQSVVVSATVTAVFDFCVLISARNTANPGSLTIHGTLSIQNSILTGLTGKAMTVYGTLTAANTTFTKNEDSVIALPRFGFTVEIINCEFSRNWSPVGTVLLMSLAGSGTSSATKVWIEGSTFIENTAAMGGSFLYLNIDQNIEFASEQLTEPRYLTIKDSQFIRNPGYLCLIRSKSLNITMSNNSFTDHDYGIILQLYDSSLTITNTAISDITRFVVVTFLSGLLTIADLTVQKVTGGPVILIRNGAKITSGFADLSNIAVFDGSLSPQTSYSISIFTLNAAVRVSNLTVSRGQGYGCACGCYFFSFAQLSTASVTNMTLYAGALTVYLYSQGSATDLSLSNVTLTSAGLSAMYFSSVSIRNISMDPGEAGYFLRPRPFYNVMAIFDSDISLVDGQFNLPAIANYVAFYVWHSKLSVKRVSFPVLFSNLANLYATSQMQMSDAAIGKFYSGYLLFISFHCNATLVNITTEDVVLNSSLLSALSQSYIYCDNITLPIVSFQSLVIASNSIVEVKNVNIENLRADTLFWYVTSRNSEFDLMQLISGVITLKSVRFEGVTVRRRFIMLSKGTVEFIDFQLSNMTATTVIPFCNAEKSSEIYIKNSILDGIESREQGLMQLHNSSLTIENSKISHFNVTFIYANKANFTVRWSEIASGGLKFMSKDAKVKVSAGLIDCIDSVVLITGSKFEDVSGNNGGVVVVSSLRLTSILRVDISQFLGCSADQDGGVFLAHGGDVRISGSVFDGNYGRRGGVLSFECEDPKACSGSIQDCNFTHNSALEGGVVKWTKVRPQYEAVTSTNNTAVYGNFEASIATHTSQVTTNSSVILGVAGVVVTQPILIAFFDVLEQVVATDNTSAVRLISEHVIGTTYLVAVNGIATFAGVIIQTTPGTRIIIDAFSPSINTTFPGSQGVLTSFVYEARVCIPGEITSIKGCYVCPKNTFSVDPFDPDCRSCPSYATCPGGMLLILDPGHWRPSELSSDVYMCPIPGACEGTQNSTCAPGYSNRLCSKCDTGYYTVGLTYCMKCEALYVRVIRGLVVLAIMLTSTGILVWRASLEEDVSRASKCLPTAKILLGFIQSLLYLSLINVDWKFVPMSLFSFLEMMVSFGQAALLVECWDAEEMTLLSPVYLKAIISGLFPVLLSLLCGLLAVILSAHHRTKTIIIRSFFTAFLITHPYLVKTAILTVACKSIDNASYWLIADSSVECWHGQHLLLTYTLFLPMLIIYIYGVPLVGLCLRNHERSHPGVYLVLELGYLGEKWWWSWVVNLRRATLLVMLGLLGAVEAVIQIISALVVLYMCLEWQVRSQPFENSAHNLLEGISLLLQVGFASLSFYFIVELHIPVLVLTVLSYILLAISLIFLLTCCGLMIAQCWEKKVVNEMEMSTVIRPPNGSFASMDVRSKIEGIIE